MANEEKILETLAAIQSEIMSLRSDVDLIKKGNALNIFNRLDKTLEIRALDFLDNVHSELIARFIQDESPETIAIILVCIDAYSAACILNCLPGDISAEVIKKISELDKISGEVVRSIEGKLFDKLSRLLSTHDFVTVDDGFSSVIKILNSASAYTKVDIIETLFERDSELAEKIKRSLFAFDDILNFDNRSVQLILRHVNESDLLFAMQGVSQEVADKIYKNMSKRNAELLREDVAAMKNVDMREVEEARFKIENVIRALDEKGEIIIYRMPFE